MRKTEIQDFLFFAYISIKGKKKCYTFSAKTAHPQIEPTRKWRLLLCAVIAAGERVSGFVSGGNGVMIDEFTS